MANSTARVVPIGYLLTDDAIQVLIGADAEWRRLNSEWEQQAGRKPSDAAYQAVCTRQEHITGALEAAVISGQLQPVALKRGKAGEWVEHQLPSEYWPKVSGNLALWTGSVDRLGLAPADQWIEDAPLCFRRADWERWMARQRNQETNEGRALSADTPQSSTVGGERPDAWAKLMVDSIAGDGRQLKRVQFQEMMLEIFQPRLPDKVVDAIWGSVTPPEWKKEGQGRLPGSKAVVNWRTYLKS